MNRLTLNVEGPAPLINKNIYGHFSEHIGRCVYEGYWVGEDSPIPNTRGIRNDVVAALRKVRPPALRWPGGCFADEYHWMDGIGPRDRRPAMLNTHWGGVTENNHFGTHEFFDLCDLLGAEPYICGNVGSGTVREMQQWVEYITFDGRSPMADLRRANGRERPWRLPYFGVGNENWGCGGNMRAEDYADVYRRYQTYVRHLSGNRVYRIACGACSADYHWTEVLMSRAGWHMDGLSLHHYLVPNTWERKGSATDFGEPEWFATLQKALFYEELVVKHAAIMDRFDPDKRIGIIFDEWGTWYDCEPGTNPGFNFQQNTMRDALVAGTVLNIFNNHGDRVRMANIAQTVNVLQALVLTDGPKMIVTPTYHVFEMYKVHQDATRVPAVLEGEPYEFKGETIPALNVSASRDGAGRLHVSLCHANPSGDAAVSCDLRGMKPKRITGRVLTAGAVNAHNTFAEPDAVRPAVFKGARLDGQGFAATLPPKSVVMLELE
jgi:alpha-N-arabinofuranosidase